MTKQYGRRYYDAFCQCCGKPKKSVLVFHEFCLACRFGKIIRRPLYAVGILIIAILIIAVLLDK